jgi:hypothetical protein
MFSKQRADQAAGGVFLIGLGLLFAGVMSFWPGILFVIGAANIARGMAEGRAWYNVSGGLGLIALGVIFLLGFNWPLLLILIGLSMLSGYSFKSDWRWGAVCDDEGEAEEAEPKRKRKNEELDNARVEV